MKINLYAKITLQVALQGLLAQGRTGIAKIAQGRQIFLMGGGLTC